MWCVWAYLCGDKVGDEEEDRDDQLGQECVIHSHQNKGRHRRVLEMERGVEDSKFQTLD